MVKVDIVRAIQLGTDLQFGEAEKVGQRHVGNDQRKIRER